MSGIGWIEDLDAQAACEAVLSVQPKHLQAEADRLALAAHWADVHNGDAPDARGNVLPGMEQAKRLGSPGTPRVREFATADLAGLVGCSIVPASNLIADALNLRHRHPLLWAAVHALEVRVWQAQRIAGTVPRPASLWSGPGGWTPRPPTTPARRPGGGA